MKTNGQIEDEISNAMSQFERKFWGHGPKNIRTILIGELAMVRICYENTPAESHLLHDAFHSELLAQSRRLAISQAREELCNVVSKAVGTRVARFFHDSDVVSSTRMFVFEFEG
jgi:uncharacterized protein YbcI